MLYNYIFIRTYAVAKLISYDVPEYKALTFFSLLLTFNFIELANILIIAFNFRIKIPLLVYLLIFIILLIINYSHFIKNENYKMIKKKLMFNNKIKIFIFDFIALIYVGLTTFFLFATYKTG